MTTNKPNVVSWGSFYKGVMQDFGYNEEATKAAAELDFHGRTLSIEPLIRLSGHEALQAECESLRKAAEVSAADANDAERELETVKAECEKLRKDAERYRWLRDKSESLHSFYLSTPVWMTGVRFHPENVNRTIDAAIQGDKS